MPKILLNDKKFDFSIDYLPSLLVGQEKSGVSVFSISVMANLFLQGHKILFLTAFPMATENFLSQIAESSRENVGIASSKEDVQKYSTKQAILIKSGDSTLFKYAFRLLDDLEDRVVFVKNIDYFDEDLIEKVLSHKKLVLSGVLEDCSARDAILTHEFRSYVTFSPIDLLDMVVPPLQKYQGYFYSDAKEGLVSLDM